MRRPAYPARMSPTSTRFALLEPATETGPLAEQALEEARSHFRRASAELDAAREHLLAAYRTAHAAAEPPREHPD